MSSEKHKHCDTFKGWAKNHPVHAKELLEESKKTCKSVFVPNKAQLKVEGNVIDVTGGIKSLDPPCLGRALSFGNSPYTCSNCDSQRRYLEDLISKREKAQYNPAIQTRYGLPGFRHSYMKISEKDKALTKERNNRIQAEKEAKRLRRMVLTTKTWEDVLFQSCENREEQKLITDLMLLFERNIAKTNPMQLRILNNLVGKLKSRNNHKFLDIIEDIGSMNKIKLG